MTDPEQSQLAVALEGATQRSIAWARAVLDHPIDPENGVLMRAQAAAAQTAINAQLRADAYLLKARRVDKALQTLLKIVEQQQAKLPMPQADF